MPGHCSSFCRTEGSTFADDGLAEQVEEYRLLLSAESLDCTYHIGPLPDDVLLDRIYRDRAQGAVLRLKKQCAGDDVN